MHAFESLTRQRQYSHLQNVVSLLGATAVLAGICVTPALAQKPPVFADPVTFCTLGEENGDCIFSRPMGLVVAELVDLEGTSDDGYPDVAVVNTGGNPQSVTVFHNTGDWSDPGSALVRIGVFSLGVNQNPYDIKAGHMGNHLGDLPADEHLDLVITLGSGKVAILYNDQNGHGQFGNREDIPLETSGPMGLVVHDLDLDGRQDIAAGTFEIVFTHSEARVEVLWRQGDNTWDHDVIGEDHNMPWGTSTDIVAGSVAKKLLSPAFLDLVVATAQYHVTLVNQGTNHQFGEAIWSESYATYPYGIVLGRFRTGVIPLDLAGGDCFDWPPCGDSVLVYWNNAYGRFDFNDWYELQSGEQVGHDPYGLAVGKINADTKEDIVVGIGHDAPCSPGGGIGVFVGYGDGTFREPPYLFCVDPDGEPKPKFVKIADMDQDGFNDVVTSNHWDGHNISVLINSLQAIPPGGSP